MKGARRTGPHQSRVTAARRCAGIVVGLPETPAPRGHLAARVIRQRLPPFLMQQTSKNLEALGVPITVSLNPIMIDGTACAACVA